MELLGPELRLYWLGSAATVPKTDALVGRVSAIQPTADHGSVLTQVSA
jgi:hypothetical protein